MAKTNSFTGHRPLEKGKFKELRKVINKWLQDPLVYCNNCGRPYLPIKPICCEDPQIGKNIQHCHALMLEVAARKKIAFNDYGANRSMTMREGVSLPPDLLQKLENYCRNRFGEKLFVNQKDLHDFMRAFPQFTICERI